MRSSVYTRVMIINVTVDTSQSVAMLQCLIMASMSFPATFAAARWTFVHVLAVPRAQEQPRIMSQSNGISARKPCCPLSFGVSSLIRVPSDYVEGTGIGIHNPDLVLYRRPDLVEQWSKIQAWSVDSHSLLWVTGPPGTGKSCAAFSFACSIDQAVWDATWVHFDRVERNSVFNCVLFKKTQKKTCVIMEANTDSQLNELLGSTSRHTIVFFDGYVDSNHMLTRLHHMAGS